MYHGGVPSRAYIYRIRISRYFYFGQTTDVERRVLSHLRQLRAGRHPNKKMQDVFDKHGEAKFRYETVETTTVERVDRLEQQSLDEHVGKRYCMNISLDAVAPMRGRSHSDEVRARMSQNRKGEANPFFGKTFTPRQLAKMRESRLGQKAWNKGTPMSEEAKRKLSQAKMGQNSGPDHYLWGKERSEETKRRISVNRRGKGAGLDSAWYGKKFSDEHRKKLSESHKGNASPRRKLTKRQVFAILRRRAAGESLSALAVRFGVTKQTIASVSKGRVYTGWFEEFGQKHGS